MRMPRHGGKDHVDSGLAGPRGAPSRGRSAAIRAENGWMRNLALLAYVILGVIVASQHDYYGHLATVSQIVSALVATAFWPLIVVGANLHLSLGRL